MPRLFLAVASSAILALVSGCQSHVDPHPVAEATWVGSAACVECHAAQFEGWTGSHHDRAMQAATPETVLGDFSGVELTSGGATSRFHRTGDDFTVRTRGPSGRLEEYRVDYTFGVEPLQQYLVSFPGGRLQSLPFAWDARPSSEGGQRWFDLNAGNPPEPGDPLHWTGPAMNWNYMCADCHSTNLRKGFDAESGAYRTTWAEVDVGCEACHGPGSAHLAWAEERHGSGLGVVGTRPGRDAEWVFDSGATIARRTPPLDDRSQDESCAACHARRTVLAEGRLPEQPLHDTHLLSRLEPGLYHADGQVLDEVFVYGSFVQSRMYRAGVQCTDCHDPHSLELRAEGNAVCARCHLPSAFDTSSHHGHADGSEGAACVACHMPARTYMTVDPRRDHSLGVPQPHLTVELGTPNACTDCHADRAAEWAAAAIESWHGPPDPARGRTARALHLGRTGAPGAAGALRALATDTARSGIARATALGHLAAHPYGATPRVLAAAAADPDPVVRLGALAGMAGQRREGLMAVLPSLLVDDRRAVRIEAARIAAPVAVQLGATHSAAFAAAANEYREALSVTADHPASWTALGAFERSLGRTIEAGAHLRRALAMDSTWTPARLELADLLAAQGLEADAGALLETGLRIAPGEAALLHALALHRVRTGRTGEALPLLERAAERAPEVPRFAYALAVARNSTGDPTGALQTVRDALDRHPWDRELLVLAATLRRDGGDPGGAQTAIDRLLEVAPEDPRVRALAAEAQGGLER